MNKMFTDTGWEHYEYWTDTHQPRMLKKINSLIDDIDRHVFTGLGKPEPLRHGDSGSWSREITREHRLVYRVEPGVIIIEKCRHHYDK